MACTGTAFRIPRFSPDQSLSQLIISVGGESNVGPSRLGIHKKLSVSLFSLARLSKDLAWPNEEITVPFRRHTEPGG